MKGLFIILSLCVLAVYTEALEGRPLYKKLDKCVKDARPDLSNTKMGTGEFKKLLTVDEQSCAMACMIRSMLENPTGPMPELVKDISSDVNREISKERLDKINLCKSKELKNDCEFMKCIDYSIPPFYEVFEMH